MSDLALLGLVSWGLVLSDCASSSLVSSGFVLSGRVPCSYRSSTTWPVDLINPHDLTHLFVLSIYFDPILLAVLFQVDPSVVIRIGLGFPSSLFLACIRFFALFMHRTALFLSYIIYKPLFSLHVAFMLHPFMHYILFLLLYIRQTSSVHAIHLFMY